MKRGFTLIELLVVVAIIGVMMAGALLTLGTGRDIAHLKEASRGVAQMAHYANALALLRQRPVVLSYTQKTGEGGAPITCIDVRLSGESMAVTGGGKPAEPIYRKVEGQDTDLAGVAAATEAAAADGEEPGVTVAERTGAFFTRKILDPEELAKEDASRVFEGISVELELLGEDGAVVDDRTAALLRDQAGGILNNRKTAIAAWSNTSGEIDIKGKGGTEEDENSAVQEKPPDHVIFETNGNCQAHRVVLRMAGEDGKSDGLTITVSRTGKVTIGDPEEK